MTDKAANGLVRRGKGPTRPPTKETKDSSRRQHMDREQHGVNVGKSSQGRRQKARCEGQVASPPVKHKY
jgi:hypothetical protein